MKAEFVGGPFDGDIKDLSLPVPYRLSRWVVTKEIPVFEGIASLEASDYVDYYLESPPRYGDLIKYVFRPH